MPTRQEEMEFALAKRLVKQLESIAISLSTLADVAYATRQEEIKRETEQWNKGFV